MTNKNTKPKDNNNIILHSIIVILIVVIAWLVFTMLTKDKQTWNQDLTKIKEEVKVISKNVEEVKS